MRSRAAFGSRNCDLLSIADKAAKRLGARANTPEEAYDIIVARSYVPSDAGGRGAVGAENIVFLAG